MVLHKIVLAISCLFITGITSAQDLYQPRSVQQAFEKGSRSENGQPGENYWQNHAVYDIHVKVNPPNRTIQGTEKITYTNNSPDTLKVLNYKLILNHHKPGAPRLRQVSEDYLTSGMHIDTYSENGVEKEWNNENNGINKVVELTQALAPQESIDLSLDWHFDVSKQSGREGAIDSTTFFLAYFYPRVAVYDDYEGWDMMAFAGSQEFYNDFNDYTFQVTVPKDYIVWATGSLLNPEEVLQKKYADLLAESMQSDEIIKIADQEALKGKAVTQQNATNTWQWKADHITDVAIAVSDQYNWDAGSVVVDSETGRRASVQAAYDEPSTDFRKMVEYGKHALQWFSNNTPGIPYPYQKMSIIRGFADMEYPMMANDNSREDPNFTRFVVEHEIAHTYFPFYMGTNETRFGFMDEGWATAFEYLIGIEDLGKEEASKNFKGFRVNRWINDPSIEQDLPIITPSNIMSGAGAGSNQYGKAGLGYLALKELLGDEMFQKSLQTYMERWNGKHPIPWDFFNSFNDVSGKNLNWFWNSWFFSNNYIDFAIQKVNLKRDKAKLHIKNVGGMPAPFDVVVTMQDGSKETYRQTPEIWVDNLVETTIELKGVKNATEISLDGGIWMDADLSDNVWIK
ncbi:MAG: M1 family metallopeptidase [Psychroflexus sp.]|nr:M1 family metallopeptidase [Psychroflexus sp.]MDN6310220.1 M1 family metallopeptidase [Psychroflexus sp.]